MKSKILMFLIVVFLISINFNGAISDSDSNSRSKASNNSDTYLQIDNPQQTKIYNAILENSQFIYTRFPFISGSNNNMIIEDPYIAKPDEKYAHNPQINLFIPPEDYKPLYSPFNYTFPYLEDLNISLEAAEYYDLICEKFNLSNDMIEKLETNGIIVVNHTRINGYNPQLTSFLNAYELYWQKDLPIFITTDTILNTFHLLFDTMLKDIEKESLASKTELMSKLLMKDGLVLYASLGGGLQKDISKEALIFFAVAAYLMDDSIVIPAAIQHDVKYYVDKIMKATEVVQEYTYDGKAFYADYTQYKPRGHYAGDELLEKYFRCMMWYGRKSLDMNLSNDVREAVLITKLIEDNTEAKQLWYDVYNITRYLVGASDSLSFNDIKRGVMNSIGAISLEMLESDDNVQQIIDEFQKPDYLTQRILSTVVMKSPSQAFGQMDFPKIFQFMGQRYVPDSEVIQNVIYDRVPLYEGRRRGLANGLDVMTSLGSFRALEHLDDELTHFNYTEYLEYSYNLMDRMTDEFWNETTYNGWLDSYSTLISNTENSSQPFMRTSAWADEKLNSVLGSWAELRHDTILYAKQPYSPGVTCSTPDAWVEPYPTFYRRIAELSNRTITILMENIPDSGVAQRLIGVFTKFESINYNLSTISEKELKNEVLALEEKNFLKSIFSLKFIGCGDKIKYGWLPELLEETGVEDKKMDTRIIADVNTDSGSQVPPMPPRVLHVGVGYVETLIVLYKKADGNYAFAVGPVYSYYEFPLQGFNRLDDDEWKDRLDSGNQKRPFWAKSFLVNGEDCLVNVFE
jgi:hypothetical protein